MYLSSLMLDAQHPQARRDLSDGYEMHRTLARAFANTTGASLPRFLWRLEPVPLASPTAKVLVQSDARADWTILDALPGYAVELRGNKEVDLARLIRNARRYRFRLFANPTVTRQGKRLGLVQEADQIEWLGRQAARHGFTVVGCERRAAERVQMRQGRSGNRIVIQGALFEGLLQVTDSSRLGGAVRAGIGHAKALGFGMLSLAPM